MSAKPDHDFESEARELRAERFDRLVAALFVLGAIALGVWTACGVGA